MVERMFIPLLGISYRPYRNNLYNYMKNNNKCVLPYLQFYCYFFVITFRCPWKHITNGEVYSIYYSFLNHKLIRKWGSV